MRRNSVGFSVVVGLVSVVGTSFALSALAQNVVPKGGIEPPRKEYSPYAEDYYPDQVYFGDIHLHSDWSTDAGMVGATLGPDEAYRASRGEAVTAYSGYRFKLIRPLDFVVLSDHAENLGIADFIRRSDPICLANPGCKRWHDLNRAGRGYDAFLEWLRGLPEDQIKEPKMAKAVWPQVVANADKYYEPGKFTTFTAFEWTSQPGGNNLHRVVIFRDDASKTGQILPFSQFDSPDPEDLWAYLAAYENMTGGRVISPAHNGNASNGLMFDTKTLDGGPLTAAYAQMRMRFEPIYEVTQIKGDGEAHPLLSQEDEFADFENMDKANLPATAAKTPDMLPGEYARSALKRGLELERAIGANPYKFGLAGASDAHNALPSTREENFFGKAHIVEPTTKRADYVMVQAPKDPKLNMLSADQSASGLTAVWARENTREGIFDAMERKEVYATTGTRLRVRVFGGWDFDPAEVSRPDFARVGYARGVPMGGDLEKAPAGKAPGFMIRAIRDPDGANLDRVQVIKGYLDANGEAREKIYDVAVSDGRKIRNDRCKKPVGNTVDVARASYTNSIGDPLLAVYWQDPDFDASQPAFYYVRVIEIPTPRWTAYDAKRLGSKFPRGTKMIIQDRAYTSPIWYSP